MVGPAQDRKISQFSFKLTAESRDFHTTNSYLAKEVSPFPITHHLFLSILFGYFWTKLISIGYLICYNEIGLIPGLLDPIRLGIELEYGI